MQLVLSCLAVCVHAVRAQQSRSEALPTASVTETLVGLRDDRTHIVGPREDASIHGAGYIIAACFGVAIICCGGFALFHRRTTASIVAKQAVQREREIRRYLADFDAPQPAGLSLARRSAPQVVAPTRDDGSLPSQSSPESSPVAARAAHFSTPLPSPVKSKCSDSLVGTSRKAAPTTLSGSVNESEQGLGNSSDKLGTPLHQSDKGHGRGRGKRCLVLASPLVFNDEAPTFVSGDARMSLRSPTPSFTPRSEELVVPLPFVARRARRISNARSARNGDGGRESDGRGRRAFSDCDAESSVSIRSSTHSRAMGLPPALSPVPPQCCSCTERSESTALCIRCEATFCSACSLTEQGGGKCAHDIVYSCVSCGKRPCAGQSTQCASCETQSRRRSRMPYL